MQSLEADNQKSSYLFSVLHEIQIIYLDASIGRFHKGDEDSHQAGFTGTIWSEEAKHSILNFQIHIFEGSVPVFVDFV